jgi:hypothetical protein
MLITLNHFIMNKLLLIIAALSLYSCGLTFDVDDEVVPDIDYFLTLTEEVPITFTSDGGEVAVSVTTNYKQWNVSCDQTWCTVTHEQGRFVVVAPANNSETAMPMATITVTANNGYETLATKTITVNQAAKEPVVVNAVDLSANGTSNSYIITASGDYSFDATTVGNGAVGVVDAAFHTTDAKIAPVSAGLVWQSYWDATNSKGLISNVALNEDGTKVVFTIPNPIVYGNALVAVYDAAGAILWSWHIWIPDYEIKSIHSKSGYEVMNINIGAVTNEPGDARSYGLLYQWGRKDPLTSSPTPTGDANTVGYPIYDGQGNQLTIGYSSWSDTQSNTLPYSIQNPTICLSNYSQYSSSRDWLKAGTSIDALWGNPEGNYRDTETNTYPNKGVKTIYDPCPVGWRVPPIDVFRHFTSSGGFVWTLEDHNVRDVNQDGQITIDGDYNYGWQFYVDDGVASYFPAAARYDGSYAMLMGSVSGIWGTYWSNAYGYSQYLPGGASVAITFQIATQTGQAAYQASPAGVAGRADAYSVRCMRE